MKLKMTEEEIAFSEIIGDLVEQWGFNRHLGRIWSLLYLRQEPLSPSDIQEVLALSAGSVSAALSELQMWGVVKRIRVAGDRNFYYEPETHIWRSVANVLRSREIRILEEAQGGLDALTGTLQKRGKEAAEFQVKRVKHVRDAIETAQTLVHNLIDPTALSSVKVRSLFQKLRTL